MRTIAVAPYDPAKARLEALGYEHEGDWGEERVHRRCHTEGM
jgi:hypothetical protein